MAFQVQELAQLSRRVIEVVIGIDGVGRGCRIAVNEQVLRASVDDVIFEYVVGGEVLDLELTFTGIFGVVVVEGVVDEGAVVGTAALIVVAADGEAGGIVVVDQVVTDGDEAAGFAGPLTGDFQSEVGIADDVGSMVTRVQPSQ